MLPIDLPSFRLHPGYPDGQTAFLLEGPPGSDVGMMVERDDNRHPGAHDGPHVGQQCPFHVVFRLGGGRTVQHEEHRVQRPGGPQAVEKLAAEAGERGVGDGWWDENRRRDDLLRCPRAGLAPAGWVQPRVGDPARHPTTRGGAAVLDLKQAEAAPLTQQFSA